jgi:hypothetical protein
LNQAVQSTVIKEIGVFLFIIYYLLFIIILFKIKV